ncbi:hypothetical protein FOL47_011116 [Perkinsus chesapeaki]|uniref:UbiA prenyltransferase domain-containing protein 1 n=1 Tax=Perkinsus chesapeaki TaxID=330153 RepID=A0A7J6MNC4_PERCH|nr:hypothetical protein FOL47_011116 [Perkinsus chesapeaki]
MAALSSIDVLRVSRPCMWFVLIWFYLWPTGGIWELFTSSSFYLGLLTSTFPFNLLMFGMNDMFDFDVDQLHERKGGFVFGARSSKKQLAELPFLIAISNAVPLAVMLAITGKLTPLLWAGGFLFCNLLYNVPPMSLARKGPWELPCVLIGVSCVTAFSCAVNDLPLPSIGAWLYHWMVMARGQLHGEIIDIDDDTRVGKNTTAVKIGKHLSHKLMLSLTVGTCVVSYVLLKSRLLAAYYVVDILLAQIITNHDSEKTLVIFKMQSLIGIPFLGFFPASLGLALTWEYLRLLLSAGQHQGMLESSYAWSGIGWP